MKVTLKKASELSRALSAAAKAVEIKATLSISAYSDTDVIEAVDKGREGFFSALSRASFLITSAYELRIAIGNANHSAGITEMLTEVAAIDETLKIFATHAEAVSIYEQHADSDDLTSVVRRVAQARNEVHSEEARRYGRTDNVTVALLGTAEKAKIAENTATLKRQRAALKDKITGLNFNTHVDLSEDVILALKGEKLIEA